MDLNYQKDRLFAQEFFKHYCENYKDDLNIYECNLDLEVKSLPALKKNNTYFEVNG